MPQKLTRRTFLRNGLAGMCTAAAIKMPATRGHGAEPESGRPNIIYILSDDVGYGDLGCYGATKVRTPNLDRLASQGLRFTDAHAPSAMCTPTRYAILTGEYAWRGANPTGVINGDAALIIRPNTLTVPALLKQAGYTTGAVGKWHLGFGEKGNGPDYNADLKPGPLEVGFDCFFGYSATNDRVPCVYIENHRVVNLDPKDPIEIAYGKPVGNDPTGQSHPELLKMKPAFGHNNTIVNGISRIGYMSGGKAARWKDEEMTDTLTGKAVAFIEKNRDRPFFLYFTPQNIHVPRVPGPRFAGKSAAGTRGDSMEELDWAVGQIMAALDRLGIAGNTLLIFTSDNGGVMNDGYQDGSGNDTSGHLCNGPLRGYKGGLFEGGTRVPFVARWPARIKAGQTSSQMISLVDLLGTCAALVGRGLPADAAPDSFNDLPALLDAGLAEPVRKDLIVHAGSGALAIREGKWKLIPQQVGPRGAVRQQAQLYDLSTDLAEKNNVVAEHPDIAKRLTDLLEKYRKSGRSRGV